SYGTIIRTLMRRSSYSRGICASIFEMVPCASQLGRCSWFRKALSTSPTQPKRSSCCSSSRAVSSIPATKAASERPQTTFGFEWRRDESGALGSIPFSVAISHVARKLLAIVYAACARGQSFDPTKYVLSELTPYCLSSLSKAVCVLRAPPVL